MLTIPSSMDANTNPALTANADPALTTDANAPTDWPYAPQEEGISGYVEVCVRCLRGVRDKLPRGLYSVSLALLSRLGATPLGQAEDEETGWARTTRPVEHQGRFFDAELHFNQSLVMVSCSWLKLKVGCHGWCSRLVVMVGLMVGGHGW